MSRHLILTFLSAALTALSFPTANWWWCAWISLLPLLIVLDEVTEHEAPLYGYIWGCLFFALSVYWLRYVTIIGWLFACGYLACYPALAALGISWILHSRARHTQHFGSLFLLLGIPAAWVVSEWMRSEIPIFAFGWNLLGFTQADNALVAQLANLCGAYGVSFLLLMTNTLGVIIWRERATIATQLSALRQLAIPLLMVSFAVGATAAYGNTVLHKPISGHKIRVGIIQGNIPQEEKWLPQLKDAIITQYLGLTQLAAHDTSDLLVWPEAAYPGYFNRDAERERVLNDIKDINTPLLLGGLHEEDGQAYNSAYLINHNGEIVERYDKMHLVPFGEYVPLHPILFSIDALAAVLGISDFRAGASQTVFTLPQQHSVAADGTATHFGVLICFENTLPRFATQLINKGAHFLITITNDAWFGRSAAPYQHVQASVFRAIENGVAMLHVANTGVSCFITPTGRIIDRVHNQKGSDIFIAGALSRMVTVASGHTFYRHIGHYFPVFCAVGLLLLYACQMLIPRAHTADRGM